MSRSDYLLLYSETSVLVLQFYTVNVNRLLSYHFFFCFSLLLPLHTQSVYRIALTTILQNALIIHGRGWPLGNIVLDPTIVVAHIKQHY